MILVLLNRKKIYVNHIQVLFALKGYLNLWVCEHGDREGFEIIKSFHLVLYAESVFSI